MKKVLSVVIVLMLILTAVTACGKKADPDSLKKIGDLAKLESKGFTYTDDMYVTVFINQGDLYRAEAKLSADVVEALDALSWEDDDHTKKVKELVAPLEITKLINISEGILSQEELDKLIGKTGQDLLNEGWKSLSYIPDDHSIYMEYGYFQYNVSFDGTIVETDEMDTDEVVRPLTVQSIEYIGMSSSALNFEY